MIKLTTPVIVQEEISSNQVSVDCYTDNPNTKTVQVNILIGKNSAGDAVYKLLILWEGEEYDTIGQWTETDAENRIKELLTQN